MYQSKYARGLCCWHSCKERAILRCATPGWNEKSNEEQLYCGAHWERVLSIPGLPVDQLCISFLFVHGPVDESKNQ